MAIEFSIDREDLMRALKPFFGARKHAKSAALDCVDIRAQENEVEFITTGFSSSVKAEVSSSGCARFPFPLFETLFRNPQKLAWTSAGRLSIRITEGQIQAGATIFNHPDVSIQAFKERIAELPIDASLSDTLTLTLRFTDEELVDSGLWDKVLAAQEQSTRLIEDAARRLAPFGIGQEAVRRFVWEQLSQRSHTDKNSMEKSETLYERLSPEAKERVFRQVAEYLELEQVKKARIEEQKIAAEKTKTD